MHIKLTEYIRATTLTLNIKDAPMTALPLIKDAFAKLATDLEEMTGPAHPKVWDKEYAAVFTPVEGSEPEPECLIMAEELNAQEPVTETEVGGMKVVLVDEIPPSDPETHSAEPSKRRGRPPKAKEEPAPAVEPTPLEAAIAAKEDEQSQGEIAPFAQPESSGTAQESATVAGTPTTPNPVSDFDMNSYLAKVCNQSKGAAYKETIYELAKPFVEEGAVPRPSNIKGDDKRWQFIKAVEADSNVKFHG